MPAREQGKAPRRNEKCPSHPAGRTPGRQQRAAQARRPHRSSARSSHSLEGCESTVTRSGSHLWAARSATSPGGLCAPPRSGALSAELPALRAPLDSRAITAFDDSGVGGDTTLSARPVPSLQLSPGPVRRHHLIRAERPSRQRTLALVRRACATAVARVPGAGAWVVRHSRAAADADDDVLLSSVVAPSAAALNLV
jgi:hypothetical protein